jgi:hypothetical protein
MTLRETERKLAAELEAHDNVDIALSEELFKRGCPLCRHRVVQGRRFLRSLVYEGINDVGFRKVLERSRGFCERHTVGLYEADRDEMGGALGAAILLESVLRHRLQELAGAKAVSSRINRQRLDLAASAPDCPACAAEDEGVKHAIERLLLRLENERWREALANATLCLADTVRLAQAAAIDEKRLASVQPVLERQLARLTKLRAALEAFAHDSTYDRQHGLTREQHVSAAQATETLGGRQGWEWRHGHDKAEESDSEPSE